MSTTVETHTNIAPQTPLTVELEHVVHGFWRQVEKSPSVPSMHTLVADRFVPIAWEQFGKSVSRIAAFMLDRQVAVHDYVAIWSNNRAEWHIADMAILSLRGQPVPVYLSVSEDQAQYIMEHSASTMIFVENDKLLKHILAVRDKLPNLKTIVIFEHGDGALPEGVVLWSKALELGEACLDKQEETLVERRNQVTFDDTATLIYTSGTTGPPKAVCLSHKNIACGVAAIQQLIPTTSEDRVLSYLPLAHIAERNVSEFRSYVTGIQVYFLDSLDHLQERLVEVKPTQFLGVPRVWEKMATQVQKKLENTHGIQGRIAHWALAVANRWVAVSRKGTKPSAFLALQHSIADNLVYSKVRAGVGFDHAHVLGSGAAPISPDVLWFFEGLGLHIGEVYGQTENTAICTYNAPGKIRIGTAGLPFPGIEVKIADDGEILTRGGTVFTGYLKNEASTKETLVDGWLYTGDIGVIDSDGYLTITDRKKDLIITAGGKNISPSNIELAISRLTLIGNAVAIGDRRPYMSALITLDPDELKEWGKKHNIDVSDNTAVLSNEEIKLTVQQQIDHVNAELNHAEQIKRWTLLPTPFVIGEELTPTLKVKRKVVTDKYAKEIESMYATSKKSE